MALLDTKDMIDRAERVLVQVSDQRRTLQIACDRILPLIGKMSGETALLMAADIRGSHLRQALMQAARLSTELDNRKMNAIAYELKLAKFARLRFITSRETKKILKSNEYKGVVSQHKSQVYRNEPRWQALALRHSQVVRIENDIMTAVNILRKSHSEGMDTVPGQLPDDMDIKVSEDITREEIDLMKKLVSQFSSIANNSTNENIRSYQMNTGDRVKYEPGMRGEERYNAAGNYIDRYGLTRPDFIPGGGN